MSNEITSSEEPLRTRIIIGPTRQELCPFQLIFEPFEESQELPGEEQFDWVLGEFILGGD